MFETQYIVIGIIQGITEFLPISSSAHLILISELTTWEDQGIFTDISVHAGTLGAVIIYLLRYIKKIFIDFFSLKKMNNYFMVKIVIATVPALIVGFVVYEYLIIYLRSVIVIAWASIIFGIILFIADRKTDSNKTWEEISFFEAFIIGLCQTLAFIPGASRAGVTITGARLFNVKRNSAAIFSMLLSIPIIIASLTLALIDVYSLDLTEIDFTKQIISSFIASLLLGIIE